MRNKMTLIVLALGLSYGCDDASQQTVEEMMITPNQGGVMDQGVQNGPDQRIQEELDQAPMLEPIIVPEFGRTAEREVVVVARRSDGLSHPRDLSFDPDTPDLLWIVDRDWDGNIVIFEAGADSQRIERLRDMAASHFMDEVSSIAFSDQGSFATCQESRNGLDGLNPFPDDFMGPVLWSTDLMIHCAVNQEEAFGGLNGSHLDMLHQSPLCMGIAHQEAHAFFVADGTHSHIVRYDFQEPHVPGGDDHSDGRVSRYPELSFTRVPNIPSHMQVVGAQLFYIDTGAGALKVASINTGEETSTLIPQNEPLELFNVIEGVEQRVLIEGLDTPSGLLVTDERIFISLPNTGEIIAYDLEGSELERLETGVPGVMGLTLNAQGEIWFVNAYAGTVNRLIPESLRERDATSPISPTQDECQYPEWGEQIGLGHVLPPFSWASSMRDGRSTGPLSTLSIFCDPEWSDVETVTFVVVPEWVQWLIEYVEYIDALVPLIEAESGRVIYVGAQTLEGRPIGLEATDNLLVDVTSQHGGVHVAEADNMFDFKLIDTPLIRHLPAAFMVRRSDMTVIATQINRGVEHLPYVEIAQDPEADWSDPGPATILPTFPSNCPEGSDESGEPNNTPEEATRIELGEVSGGICERRGDFYFIDVEGSWRLDLEFSHAVGDLDLVLFNEGQPLYDRQGMPRGAGSGTDNETFEWSGPQMVYIYGYDNSTSPYQLIISER